MQQVVSLLSTRWLLCSFSSCASSTIYTSREILTPASVNKLFDVWTDNQLRRKARFSSRVYHDWRAVGKVMTNDFRLRRVDVRRRLKARPSSPEEISYIKRNARVIM